MAPTTEFYHINLINALDFSANSHFKAVINSHRFQSWIYLDYALKKL